MKLLSFKGYKPGVLNRLGEFLIKLRLRGIYSHSEVMFEPSDGHAVALLMPDKSLEPDSDGAYWCSSSVWLERIPAYSPRRAGSLGGVRFKRVVPDLSKYDIIDTSNSDALYAAELASNYQGSLYDLQLIIGFISWLIPGKRSRWMCSEICAAMLGVPEDQSWRFDPCSLHESVASLNKPKSKQKIEPAGTN